MTDVGSVKIYMSDGTEIDDDEILKNCADGTILHFVCESAERKAYQVAARRLSLHPVSIFYGKKPNVHFYKWRVFLLFLYFLLEMEVQCCTCGAHPSMWGGGGDNCRV